MKSKGKKMDFGKCSEISNNRIVVFEERKSKITFNNLKRKRVSKVDVECLRLRGKSCDGLLIELKKIPKSKDFETHFEHFVELKGSHVGTAIKQLENTIKQISFDPKTQRKCCYISSTKSPKIDTTMQKIKLRFKQSFDSGIVINTGHFKVKI